MVIAAIGFIVRSVPIEAYGAGAKAVGTVLGRGGCCVIKFCCGGKEVVVREMGAVNGADIISEGVRFTAE